MVIGLQRHLKRFVIILILNFDGGKIEMAYAEKTSVSVAKTKADIEEMVQRYGADQFVSGYQTSRHVSTGILPDGARNGRRRQHSPHGSRPAGAGGGHCI